MNELANEEPIGQLIRRARRQSGLSQTDLATALVAASGNQSLTREHIARWERGLHIPSPYWRGWLARTLHLARHQIDDSVRATKREQLERRGDQKI